MTPQSRRARWPAVALILLCCALAGIVAVEVAAPLPRADTATAAAPPSAPIPPPSPAAQPAEPPLTEFGETTARPLFSATRRPPPAVPASSGTQTQFALVGVAILSGESLAILEYGNPPHLARVGVGQDIESWRVDTIEPDRVLLQRGVTRQEIRLKDKSPASAGKSTPPAPAATPVPAIATPRAGTTGRRTE